MIPGKRPRRAQRWRWALLALAIAGSGGILIFNHPLTPWKSSAGSVPAALLDPTEAGLDPSDPKANPLLRLNNPTLPPRHDLELLRDALAGLRQGAGKPLSPIGHNRDLARVLSGHNPQGLVWLPRNHPALDPASGEILDRWGHPFWIHPWGDGLYSVRSAGPDGRLFSADDLALEPKSPPVIQAGTGPRRPGQPAPITSGP